MQHRIIVLGAGYAGAYAAGLLARRLRRDEVAITVVNAEADFAERLRLHQVAAGRELRRYPLEAMFAGTGVDVRVARATGIDADRRTVTVDDGRDADELAFDTLLYTLGSAASVGAVPGADEHAHHVTTRPGALRLRRRLDEVGEGGRVLVVGGNLTAIETATEIAESHPGLDVAVATSGRVGDWLDDRARAHLARAFDRFGIAVHEHATVDRVDRGGAVTADGTALTADATVWAAGFAVGPLAADADLAVESDGRITVDRQMRSVSHPGVYAAGDSVFTIAGSGRPLPMSCASAGYTAMRAASAIIGDLTGRTVAETPLAYIGNHISLGRRDAIFQFVDGRARSKRSLRGRGAARIKAGILNASAWSLHHPTFGIPRRRHRLASAAAEAVVA